MSRLSEIIGEAARYAEGANDRLIALNRFKDNSMSFDPAGFDFIKIWVSSINADRRQDLVTAMRIGRDTNWLWRKPDGQLGHGRWEDLLEDLTTGTSFPIAYEVPTASRVTSLTDQHFEPRQLA